MWVDHESLHFACSTVESDAAYCVCIHSSTFPWGKFIITILKYKISKICEFGRNFSLIIYLINIFINTTLRTDHDGRAFRFEMTLQSGKRGS